MSATPGLAVDAAPRPAHPAAPSPPAPALRLVPAPACDPPYLDEGMAAERARAQTSAQTVLALEFPLPTGLPAEPVVPPRLQLVDDDPFGVVATPRSALPAATPWTARLAQAIAEVVAGDRPLGQLVRWTTCEVLDTLTEQAVLRRRGPTAGPGRRRAQVRSLRVTEPADGVIEAAVLVVGAGRPLPMALRLEGLDGRWQCTVLELPTLPRPAA